MTSRSEAMQELTKPGYLLGVDADPKTIKGRALDTVTAIQYLAAATASGIADVCKYKSKACEAFCLFGQGRASFTPNIKPARITRTIWLFKERAQYDEQLGNELVALLRKADRENMNAACRLNGTSDLPWERMKFTYKGVTYPNVMEAFPGISFYDYTKYPISERPVNSLPDNYHLTYSYSENTSYREYLENINAGRNIAVVFRVKRGHDLPTTWRGIRVIDGDYNGDVRYLDPKGVIVGLRMKGTVRQDQSGFVQEA